MKTKSPGTNPENSGGGSKNSDSDIFSQTTLFIVLCSVGLILTIGFAQSLNDPFRSSPTFRSKWVPGLIGFTFGMSILAIPFIYAIVTTGTQNERMIIQFAASLLLIVLVALSQFALPRWWWLVLNCDVLADSLRSKRDGTKFELPGLAYLNGIARLLLPDPDGDVELRELDTPFQHQQFKDLLRHCTREFGRVVVLIDDVDILPSEHFHEVFRTLRPASKVANLRVVICVPRFFFNAFRSDTLGDVHSTVRQVYMLGDPTVYDNDKKDSKFQLRKQSDTTFKPFLRTMLRSRLRLPVPFGSRDLSGTNIDCLPVEFVVERWTDSLEKEDWGRINQFLNRIGPSWRELLRETERLLRNQNAKPFDFFVPHDQNEINVQLDGLKSDYHDDETSLHTNLEERINDRNARAALEGRSPKAPSSPPR